MIRAHALLESAGREAQDVVRLFRRSPTFASLAVFTIALGIGATATIFSVVESVLLKPLSFPSADRLVRIYESNPAKGLSRMMDSSGDIADIARDSTAFKGIAVFRIDGATLTGSGEPEEIVGATVSPSFFNVLGVRPAIGRLFAQDGALRGTGQEVILAYSLWQRRFECDPSVLGRTLKLNEKLYTVIGVMPPDFSFPPVEAPLPFKTEFWLPWLGPESFGNRDLASIARLRNGVSLDQAQSEMGTISDRLESEHPVDRQWKLTLVSLGESVTGRIRTPILVLFAAVGFVLLVACANFANLILTNIVGRQREIAIRHALGASRARVVRQLLFESVSLALLGGGLGTILAVWPVKWIRHYGPPDIPQLMHIRVSWPVVAFGLGTSVLSGILFGLAPALIASKRAGLDLRAGGFGMSRTGFRWSAPHGARNSIVICQLALSLVLLIGAGLMTRSFLSLTSVDLGFRPGGLLTFVAAPSGPRYSHDVSQLRFYDEVLRNVSVLPGVGSVGLVDASVLSDNNTTNFELETRGFGTRGVQPEAKFRTVSEDYFRTMQIPILRGRAFNREDRLGSPPVIIVNQAFTRTYFDGANPIGKRIRIVSEGNSWREIVAVVADTRDTALNSPPSPEFYVSLRQVKSIGYAAFVVRAESGTSQSLVEPIRKAAFAVDPDQPIISPQTMTHVVSREIAAPRFRTALLDLFSLLALCLALLGLYGTMASIVTRQTREIGIRIALGANQGDVLRLVLGHGLMLAGIGTVTGLAGAYAVTRLVTGLLYGTTATDPLTFASSVALLVIATLGASYVPARRATRVDPAVALRYE